MIDNERNLPPLPAQDVVQRGKPGNDHHPGPYQHEGPELQHLRQPRNAAPTRLNYETHQDGKPGCIAQARDGCRKVHHPFEGIDLPAEQEHRADEHEEQGQHDPIDRSRKQVPVDGADGQLQQQPHNKKAPSDDEAFLHSPGFSPHI